jgi:hypothetical protein
MLKESSERRERMALFKPKELDKVFSFLSVH